MKKIKSFFTIIFMVLLFAFSVGAEGENAQSAIRITLDESIVVSLNDDNYRCYFKFIPTETSWYEFSVSGIGSEDAELWIRDANGDFIDYSDWNQFNDTNKVACEISANNTYFIELEYWGISNVNLKVSVSSHIHSFELYDIYKASEYSNGYIENECTVCEYIEKITIPKVNIMCSQSEFIYSGIQQIPAVTIFDDAGKNFTEGVDYSLKLPKSSIDVDDYYIVISMENEYYEIYDYHIYYSITPKSIEDLKINLSQSKVYYGNYPTISIPGLEANKDFECDIWYWGLGEQEVTVYGIGNYTGEKKVSFTVYPANVTGLKVSKTTSSSITLSWKEDKDYSTQYYQIYDIKNKKVLATIGAYETTYTIKKLKAGTTYNFKVRSYTKENGEKYYGEWVTIAGTTKPASTNFTSLKSAKSKTFIAKWDKLTNVTGYQIQYSTNSNFSSAKTVKITKNTTNSKTVSGLKSGKKYYVRIRTYKTVKLNGKSTTVYSNWSKAKTIKIK